MSHYVHVNIPEFGPVFFGFFFRGGEGEGGNGVSFLTCIRKHSTLFKCENERFIPLV